MNWSTQLHVDRHARKGNFLLLFFKKWAWSVNIFLKKQAFGVFITESLGNSCFD